MDKAARDIFKGIYKGKWVEIEYRNKAGEVTCYWIGIKDIDAGRQMLLADGFNVATHQLAQLKLYYRSIVETNLVEGSCYPRNDELISRIQMHPREYDFIFRNVSNLKLLDYYSDCSRLDSTPYTVN